MAYTILGLSDTQHDCSAAVIRDGIVLSAISEERITGLKNQGGFPHKAIQSALEIAAVSASEIDEITFGGITTPPLLSRLLPVLDQAERASRNEKGSKLWNFISRLVQFKIGITRIKSNSIFGNLHRSVAPILLRMQLPKELKSKPIFLYDHHRSRAASAYYTSAYDAALTIVSDYWGGGLSLSLYKCEGQQIERIFEAGAKNSLGQFYTVITKLLGFRPFRHEGKITGLAAYGEVENIKLNFPFTYANHKLKYELDLGFDLPTSFKNALHAGKKEDVAAWLQFHTERMHLNIIQDVMEQHALKNTNICLAGGVFANVKLNHEICKLPSVASVWVYPEMGDGGLGIGSAYLRLRENYFNIEVSEFNMFQGWSNSESVELIAKKHGLQCKRHSAEEIADRLANKKTIATCIGRMEFGPRALTNRSILFHTGDVSVNDWLNKKLDRTEFMPFAPITLEEHADEYYLDLHKAERAARFMTMVFKVKDAMKSASPAAVHIDGTARPQLINSKDTPLIHEVLTHYFEKTGVPSLLNTSFNMHESPIVRTLDDACESFIQAELDFLITDEFILWK